MPRLITIGYVTTSLLVVAAHAMAQTDRPRAKPSPPAVVSRVIHTSGKPPMEIYRLAVEFRNTYSQPVWLILPYWANESLNRSGVFHRQHSSEPPFSTTQSLTNAQNAPHQAVLVSYFGKDNESFHALLLPVGGRIQFDAFQIESWRKISQFAIWEVSQLATNGTTPLEKWLPYNTMSDMTGHFVGNTSGELKSLDWDERLNDYRKDYPVEKVNFITAKVLRKWIIPLAASNSRSKPKKTTKRSQILRFAN